MKRINENVPDVAGNNKKIPFDLEFKKMKLRILNQFIHVLENKN